MKKSETTEYKGYDIFLNKWGEYCVCHRGRNMVVWNSGFVSLKKAQFFADKIFLRRYDEKRLEEIANEIKK